jgi:hypothetical protein
LRSFFQAPEHAAAFFPRSGKTGSESFQSLEKTCLAFPALDETGQTAAPERGSPERLKKIGLLVPVCLWLSAFALKHLAARCAYPPATA